MTTRTHDEFNALAAVEPDIQSDPIAALRRVASKAGFECGVTSDQCEIWEHEDGRNVNLWIDATDEGFQWPKEGGLGFDDQTEWAD